MQISTATNRSESNRLETRSETFSNEDDLIMKMILRECSQLRLILRARVRRQRSFGLISERAFTWHSRNNQSRLEIYFGTRLDAIASGTHDIEQSIAMFLKSRPDVISNFLPSKKNSDKPCERVQLLRFPLFPGKPVKPSKHEFEQANIPLAQRELY